MSKSINLHRVSVPPPNTATTHREIARLFWCNHRILSIGYQSVRLFSNKTGPYIYPSKCHLFAGYHIPINSKRIITVRSTPPRFFPKCHISCWESHGLADKANLSSHRMLAGLRWLLETVEKEDSHRTTEGKHLKSYVLKPASTNICRYLGYIWIAIEQESQAQVHFDHLPRLVPIFMVYVVRVCQRSTWVCSAERTPMDLVPILNHSCCGTGTADL